MSARTTAAARRLLQQTGEHPVISLYLDLDPSEFATAPARASQVDSLLDEANRAAKAIEESEDHAGKMALRGDLDRIREYLTDDELTVSGLRAIAIFASAQDDLFTTVPLVTAAGPAASIGRHPVIEPLVVAPAAPAWCAVLPSLDRAEIYIGVGERVLDHQRDDDYVRGHSAQGGSTGHDQQQDVTDHLLAVAARLREDFDEGRFTVLAVGGPVQARTEFCKLLPDPVAKVLIETPLDVDPSAAGVAQIAAAMVSLVDADQTTAHHELLTRLTAELGETRAGRQGRAVLGETDVAQALEQARVETLLLAAQFTGDPREQMIRDAVGQDAAVVAFDDTVTELGPARPVAALLRY